MSINKDDPFSEAIQLKKAKRRLIGAIIIFVFLLVLSIFFIEDRSLLNEKDLKISFIDENNHPIDEIIDEVSSEISSSSYYIQVGIFSDLMKTKQLSENIKKKRSGL
jgi:ABC-type microcin C transport system permease subunit YejE